MSTLGNAIKKKTSENNFRLFLARGCIPSNFVVSCYQFVTIVKARNWNDIEALSMGTEADPRKSHG